MARTSRRVDAGVATISPSPTSSPRSPFPTVRHGERDGHPAEISLDFDEFAAAIRAELAPEGVLESLLIDRLILDAWHLNAADRAEIAAIERAARRRGKSSTRPARGRAIVELRRDASRARHALAKAIELLRTVREHREPRWGRPAPSATQPVAVPGDEAALDDFDYDFDLDLDDFSISNEWPVVPRGEPADDAIPGDDEDEADVVAENWQDRLIFDFNVSESSPVVKGTWVTVGHVVTLIVDGWTWGDILRTHPELTEEDIRVCLAYTIAQDNGEA
jgi:uncharacterized protein (DUF433 family)